MDEPPPNYAIRTGGINNSSQQFYGFDFDRQDQQAEVSKGMDDWINLSLQVILEQD